MSRPANNNWVDAVIKIIIDGEVRSVSNIRTVYKHTYSKRIKRYTKLKASENLSDRQKTLLKKLEKHLPPSESTIRAIINDPKNKIKKESGIYVYKGADYIKKNNEINLETTLLKYLHPNFDDIYIPTNTITILTKKFSTLRVIEKLSKCFKDEIIKIENIGNSYILVTYFDYEECELINFLDRLEAKIKKES